MLLYIQGRGPSHDQWFRPNRRQQNQATSALTNGTSQPPPNDLEGGDRAKRKQAEDIRLNTIDR